jgi:hypothetical protein
MRLRVCNGRFNHEPWFSPVLFNVSFFFPYTHTFTAYLGHFSSSFLFFQGLYSRLRLKNAQSKTKDNNKKKEEREKKSTEYNESEYRTIR